MSNDSVLKLVHRMLPIMCMNVDDSDHCLKVDWEYG